MHNSPSYFDRAIFILRLKTCTYEFINIPNTESYVGRTHITQRMWQEIMGYNPSEYVGDNMPVVSISYAEIQEFIKRLSADVDSGEVFHISFDLLSEYLWEQVAGTNNNIFVDTKHIFTAGLKSGFSPAKVWSAENSSGRPHEVASLPPNEFGLYDMYGNVWDMCLDKIYNKDPERLGNESDIEYKRRCVKVRLRNGSITSGYVLKGGAWNVLKDGYTKDSRILIGANDKFVNAGFRLICEIPKFYIPTSRFLYK